MANRMISHCKRMAKVRVSFNVACSFMQEDKTKHDSCHLMIHVHIGDFLHVSHLKMKWDEEHVLGKVVLVQASEGEEDILHLHWYKRVSEVCTIHP